MKSLAIYSEDTVYNRKLSDYIGSKLSQEFMIVTYSTHDRLLKDISNNNISVLVIDKDSYEKLLSEVNKKGFDENIIGSIGKIICLVDEKNEVNSIDNVAKIYKYSPMNYLLQEISSLCINVDLADNKCRITGIFSPIGGIGKTTFSIALAKKLSHSKSVLYINLEPYSPIIERLCLNDEFTLSEMLYEYSVNKYEDLFFPKYVQQTEGISVIAPIKSLKELSEVRAEDWINLVTGIKKICEFEEVVIELSDAISDVISLFKICDKVKIPYRNKIIHMEKLNLFKSDMERELSKDFIEDRIQFMTLPELYDQQDTYEDIEETAIGEWIRGINE